MQYSAVKYEAQRSGALKAIPVDLGTQLDLNNRKNSSVLP